MRAHAHANLGRLVTPRHYPSMREHGSELVWGADNDCFQGLDAQRWRAMLDSVAAARDRGRLVFCTVPDAVGDARATAELFKVHAHELETRGLPLGYVLQDGQERVPIPWERLAAVFVGGSDDFKLGADARELVGEAKRRGLWAHMGRVNSDQRARYAHAIGCDSVDGTSHTTWRDRYLDRRLEQLASLDRQLELAA